MFVSEYFFETNIPEKLSVGIVQFYPPAPTAYFWKRIMFGWFLKKAFLDHELQEQYILGSGVDWTIVRPGAFTDGQRTGRYSHGFAADVKGLKLKISRADVADFMLRQLNDTTYLRRTPGLPY